MTRIGIDIGALFLKAVRLDADGNVLQTFYHRHHGEPSEALNEAFGQLNISQDDLLGFTGCNGEALAKTLDAPYRDVTLCQIDAVRRAGDDALSIMDIGGTSATLIQFDGGGKFVGYTTNSLCAAGTGSFLDEQAKRLEISYEDANNYPHNPAPPSIAARCTVFAKSDLIHRQQEGCSRVDMWSGLCRGMTQTLLGTLLTGRPLGGKTVVIGGVARNAEVIRWLEKSNPGLISVPVDPHLVAATGAARHAQRPKRDLQALDHGATRGGTMIARLPWPLTMEKSSYPSFATQESYEDEDGNEVRVTRWPGAGVVKIFLGIDIGSTSTKAVLTDDSCNVLADIYRKTSGDPIGATKLLFSAVRRLGDRMNSTLEVQGVGTTGSGRKIVGEVIGADAIINEISAHVAGAARTDPTIDTIFEIGGQDSKYMHLRDGHISDSNMNYVCAAGTGAFVEELAGKLGYKVSEAGPAVLGVKPPRASDRCTVFMEQDIARLIQSGATPQEAFAAVMVSVTKNYLNRVVGNRYRSREKIFFQGATARNPALVAAFERLLDVEVVVSPYCHVMGAYGVALLVREVMRTRGLAKSAFRGLDLEQRPITFRKGTCELCQNRCTITHADIGSEKQSPSWGYMCGRDPDEERMRVNPHARLLRRRQNLWQSAGKGIDVPEDAPVVGIPQALTTYTYLPLWRRFFNRLGYRIRLSGPTTQATRELGARLSGAEFCFPAKTFLGHAAALATHGGIDFLFVPQMKSEKVDAHVTNAAFCPYVQGSPACTSAAFKLNGLETAYLLSPIVDMRLEPRRLAQLLAKALAGPLQRSTREIEAAWRDGYAALRDFQNESVAEGRKVLAEAKANKEQLLVLVGRPYNLYDKGLNLGLPDKLAENGRTILPMDLLPIDLSRLGKRYRNSFWGSGQKILAALEEIAANNLLDAVYFTNFSCGPDSFLLSYTQEIMGRKPFLALELDEHGSDTGYMTRIEAYFDVLRRPRQQPAARKQFTPPPNDFRNRTLWIPHMHLFTTDFIAAALRRHGYRARPLPREAQDSLEIGRSVTRGSECLPAALTIGSLLTVLRASPHEKHAFFMPTAQGPCRFGQYVSLHRQILDREGFADVPILAPSSSNGYQGMDEPIRRSMWKGMLVGDILMKAGCKIRPHEKEAGSTNHQLERERNRVVDVLERGGNIVEAVRVAMRNIASVPTHRRDARPLVGIVGEIYIRNNTFANEDVVHSVEKLGAEAWMAPLAEWVLFTSSVANFADNGNSTLSLKGAATYVKWHWMKHWEKKLYEAASPLLDDRHEPAIVTILSDAKKYLPDNTGGEAILTVGRAIKFAEQGAAIVVNVAPFSCMPGTITSAVFRQVSAELRMPIVNMFYDGTGGQNRRLEVFLRTALGTTAGRATESRRGRR